MKVLFSRPPPSATYRNQSAGYLHVLVAMESFTPCHLALLACCRVMLGLFCSSARLEDSYSIPPTEVAFYIFMLVSSCGFRSVCVFRAVTLDAERRVNICSTIVATKMMVILLPWVFFSTCGWSLVLRFAATFCFFTKATLVQHALPSNNGQPSTCKMLSFPNTKGTLWREILEFSDGVPARHRRYGRRKRNNKGNQVNIAAAQRASSERPHTIGYARGRRGLKRVASAITRYYNRHFALASCGMRFDWAMC